MSFAAPYLLLTLLAVPLAVVGYVLLERRRARRAGAWSNSDLLPNTVRRPSRRLAYIPAGLLLLGVTLLLVGFARPHRVLNTSKGGAATVVVAMDVSGSMVATDAKPTRLQAARRVAAQFLAAVPANDRVALITFGDKVRLVLPPTLDHRRAIALLPTKITPKAGTSIGDAVSAAVAVVGSAVGTSAPANPHPPGAVLLFSDGEQTAAGTTPTDAANTAYIEGIPVSTIAVGTSAGTVTQVVNVNGQRVPAPIPVPVDAVTMKKMATQAGGTSFDASSPPTAAALHALYAPLRSRPAAANKDREFSSVAAGAAIILIFAGIVASAAWFGRVA